MELINNRPFDSISAVVSHIGVSRSTVYRKLDTGKPVVLSKLNLAVYFLSKELSSKLKDKLKIGGN